MPMYLSIDTKNIYTIKQNSRTSYDQDSQSSSSSFSAFLSDSKDGDDVAVAVAVTVDNDKFSEVIVSLDGFDNKSVSGFARIDDDSKSVSSNSRSQLSPET